MKSRKEAIIALAVAALFSGAVGAQQNTPAERQGAQAQTSGEQAGNGAQANQEGQAQGQQADQQILQQLRQFAQDPQTAPDKLFLLNTAIGSMAEVQISQQVEQKSQSEQVKQLAQRLIQDHEQLNQKLQQVAGQAGVQVPQSLPQMKVEEIRILTSQSGPELDRQFLSHMNADHAKDVACFQAESSLSQNQAVKQFASSSLPVLQQHWQMIRQVASASGVMLGEQQEAMPAAARLRGSSETGSNAGGSNNGGNTAGGQNTNGR